MGGTKDIPQIALQFKEEINIKKMFKSLPLELLRVLLLYLHGKDLHYLSFVDRYCRTNVLKCYQSLALMIYNTNHHHHRNEYFILDQISKIYRFCGIAQYQNSLASILLQQYLKMKNFITQNDTKQLLINTQQRSFISAVNQSILIKFPKSRSETITDGESVLAQQLYASIVDPSYTYWIVAADKRGQVHMFDILSGKHLQNYLYSQTSLNDLIFIPELQYVIFTNCQGIIFICDLLTGALRMRIHDDSIISCLAWAKYGNDHFLYSGHFVMIL